MGILGEVYVKIHGTLGVAKFAGLAGSMMSISTTPSLMLFLLPSGVYSCLVGSCWWSQKALSRPLPLAHLARISNQPYFCANLSRIWYSLVVAPKRVVRCLNTTDAGRALGRPEGQFLVDTQLEDPILDDVVRVVIDHSDFCARCA